MEFQTYILPQNVCRLGIHSFFVLADAHLWRDLLAYREFAFGAALPPHLASRASPALCHHPIWHTLPVIWAAGFSRPKSNSRGNLILTQVKTSSTAPPFPKNDHINFFDLKHASDNLESNEINFFFHHKKRFFDKENFSKKLFVQFYFAIFYAICKDECVTITNL